MLHKLSLLEGLSLAPPDQELLSELADMRAQVEAIDAEKVFNSYMWCDSEREQILPLWKLGNSFHKLCDTNTSHKTNIPTLDIKQRAAAHDAARTCVRSPKLPARGDVAPE
jgi:hypothetical protein